MNLNRKIILNPTKNKMINRIGGNIPIYFIDKNKLIDGLNFYACFQHPLFKELLISIFIPKDYIVLSQGKIYPNCAVKVFVHSYSDESTDVKYSCKDLNKMYFEDFIENESDEGIIQVGGIPQFIQDEEYYYNNLKKDNYIFFMQIDEAMYPDDLVIGSYPFNFGALYLYYKSNDMRNVIAGFWQNS